MEFPLRQYPNLWTPRYLDYGSFPFQWTCVIVPPLLTPTLSLIITRYLKAPSISNIQDLKHTRVLNLVVQDPAEAHTIFLHSNTSLRSLFRFLVIRVSLTTYFQLWWEQTLPFLSGICERTELGIRLDFLFHHLHRTSPPLLPKGQDERMNCLWSL